MANYVRKPLPPARQFRQLWEVLTGLVKEGRGDITINELWEEIQRLKLHHYTLQTPLMIEEIIAVEEILIKLTGTGELP